MKYSLNDISIVPASISIINSRSECCPFYENGMLPLFTAPMSSVVDLNNYKLFKQNKINPIIPRTISFDERIKLSNNTWCAFSLDEFIMITNSYKKTEKLYLLIDIANGNMIKLHDSIRKAKELHGDTFIIMAGNIANPETYSLLSDAGADYVRLSVGTGSVCATASKSGIFFPMASLIKESFELSLHLDNPAKIIADGGIKNTDDIVKCLALGADYVMCGNIFNKMLESAGKTFFENGEIYNQFDGDNILEECKLFKEYYGMSTKRAQQEMGKNKFKVSEGIEKIQSVEYTMEEWSIDFIGYLKSAMSYTSSYELSDFIGNVRTIVISQNSYNSINH